MMPNKCDATSLWRVLRACAPARGPPARRRSTPAQQPRARPEVPIVNKRRNRYKCHVSCQFEYDARTCDDGHAAAPTSSSTMKWKAQKTSARAVPSGVEQPLSSPQSSLPGHRRKRRNSLVVVTKHLNTSTKNNVCLASTRDNDYQSHNDADEEPQRSIVVQQLDGVVDEVAVQRSLVGLQFQGIVNGPQVHRSAVLWRAGVMAHKKFQNKCVQLSNKELVQAQGSTCRGIPLFLVHFHDRPRSDRGITKSELIATKKCVLCENWTRLASTQRRSRCGSHRTGAGDFWSKMTASKWSQKHKTSCERAEDAYTAAKPVSLRGSNAESSHLCNSFQQKSKKVELCVLRVLVTIPRLLPGAPRAWRASRAPGRRCTSAAQPIRARLRQLRVVLQDLEQDDDEVVTPRPETQHCGHEQKTKAQIRAKGTTERACLFVKEKTASAISKKKVPRGNLSPLQF